MGRPVSAAGIATAAAAPPSIVFKQVLRFIVISSVDRHLSRHREFDAVESGVRRHVKRLAVVAPATVGGPFRRFDRSQVLTLRSEYPYTARTGSIHISPHIHLHSIGYSVFAFGSHVG